MNKITKQKALKMQKSHLNDNKALLLFYFSIPSKTTFSSQIKFPEDDKKKRMIKIAAF